ncbi:MAG: polysaccharide biosynthesis protein [Fibrobacter sp.]|nr:polysaccharide biosynthesis protein [Fibrobacter sp.]
MTLKDLISSFRFRKRVLALADAFVVFVTGLVANFIFQVFDIYQFLSKDLLLYIGLDILFCFTGFMFYGCYNKLWRYFSGKDYFACVKAVFMGVGLGIIYAWIIRGYMPLKYGATHFVLTIAGICAIRALFKNAFLIYATSRSDARKKRTMIIGAGESCRMLLTDLLKNPKYAGRAGFENSAANILPVCLIDDDRTKLGTRICGVEVAGTSNDIVKLARLKRIELILFAIPSCPVGDRQIILNICAKTNLPVKVLPFYGQSVLEEGNTLNQIRDIKVEDLLGRDPIKFDNNDIKNFIQDKVCLVTGGGGSIGSELVRQIAKYNPRQIVIVDIYENNAYEVQQDLRMEYGDKLNLVVLIASVRDYFRMNQIIVRYKPDVIFHAAAHKHVPLMENSPMEAIKNNVLGTFNMATLALIREVKKFVMISTDKAVNPTNVMGASKRCCEMIIQYMSQQVECKTDFVTTRFGNVLGSNGSVIPLFKRQIEQGRPVTVTHPDIIRYFMTIPEAVSLVMEAASFAKGGEIFVLDMGQPVKIVTLAENLIRLSGKVPYKDVQIVFTGLRPGEKLKEELLMSEEGLQKTRNKLIYIGRQIEIDNENFARDIQSLKEAAKANEDERAIMALHKIVPTFITPEEFNGKIAEQQRL